MQRQLLRLRRGLCTARRPPLDGDAYHVLGVERGVSERQLKAAYRKMARDWHPDVSQQAGAKDVFPHITRSYEILSDQQQRSTPRHEQRSHCGSQSHRRLKIPSPRYTQPKPRTATGSSFFS